MARKIILKESGLINQSNSPDGYSFLGLSGSSLGLPEAVAAVGPNGNTDEPKTN